MAEEARKIGASLVHYSTDYVFDGAKTTPYNETDPPNPINAYGRTKLDGEHAIRAAAVPHLILRTQWVYGNRGKNFLLTILRLAAEREELRVVSDQFGAPTWSREIARATTNILGKSLRPDTGAQPFEEVSGTYNMTAAGQTTWHEFAVAILDGAVRAPQESWLRFGSGKALLAEGLFPLRRRTIRRRLGDRLIPCFPTGGSLKHSLFNCRSGALSSIPLWLSLPNNIARVFLREPRGDMVRGTGRCVRYNYICRLHFFNAREYSRRHNLRAKWSTPTSSLSEVG